MTTRILDILGVGSREDSYTDLIVTAIESIPEFQKELLDVLFEPNADDWKTFVRLPVAICKPGSDRVKDIPDIVLFSKSQNRIIVIENKLFSGEGWKQTERYATAEFQSSLIDKLEANKPSFGYYYLTISGELPASNAFKAISYINHIEKAIPGALPDSNIGLLMQELKERIEEFKNWPKPESTDKIIDYLRTCNGFVSPMQTFEWLSDFILEPHEWDYHNYACTANRGSAFIPLVNFGKCSWIGKPYNKGIQGKECFHIHFEFQWDTRKDWENTTLYLHYEMNPYMTQGETKDLCDDFVREYNLERDNFYNYILKSGLNGWKISKTPLRIAYFEFPIDSACNEAKETAQRQIVELSKAIDAYINLS